MTAPTIVDSWGGRGRLFDASLQTVLEGSDAVPGATLVTRDASVQAIVRWDLADQSAVNVRGALYVRGKMTSASEYVSAAVELRVINAGLGIGELGWMWQDIGGVVRRQVGGHFYSVPGAYVMLTATRRWVSPTKVVLRHFLGDKLLSEVESVDGSIGGGTTGTTTIGARFGGIVYTDFFDGVLDELRVVDYELTAEEIQATWLRLTKYQPLGYELVKDFHPPGFPISQNPSSRVQRESNIWGQTLGYAGAQAENMRANMLPDRAYGPVLEQWEGIMRQPAKPGDSVDTRRARVVGRLRQRAGVSPPGVREALKGLIETDEDNVDILAFSQELVEHYDRPTVWSTGDGAVVTKTAGIADWVAAAFTTQRVTGDCDLEFTRDTTVGSVELGLSPLSPAPAGATYSNIERGMFLDDGGNLRVADPAVVVTITYAAGDVFRIRRRGTVITYWKNGAVIYTSVNPSSNAFGVAFAGANTNAAVKQIRLYAVEDTEYREIGLDWINLANATATPARYVPIRDGFLIKNAGGAAWNAGASSIETIAGDGYVESTASSAATDKIFGLSSDDPDAVWNTVEYGIHLDNGGTAAPLQNGVYQAGVAYVAGDVFRVERVGTTITYKKNGVTFYTSLIASSGPLLIDTSILTVGASLASVTLVDAGERVSFTWQNMVNVQAYANAIRVQGANAEDLQYTASVNWRPAFLNVSSSPLIRMPTGLPAEGWGAHLITKIEPIALPNRAEAGVAFVDRARGHAFLFGLRNDGGTYRIVAERFVSGISQGSLNFAVTTLRAHWFHLYNVAPTPRSAVVAPLFDSYDIRFDWSITDAKSGYTSNILGHTSRFQWAALYLRSYGGTLSGATDVIFDETRLYTPYGDRSLHFYAYRPPSLAGTVDLLGGRGVVGELKQSHTRASLITSKTLLYDTDGHGYDVGPLGGY